MSLQSEAGLSKEVLSGHDYGSFTVRGADGKTAAYGIGKHSTRSKHRGYYIEQFWFSVNRVGKRVVVKNLNRAELIAWVKLLKGES